MTISFCFQHVQKLLKTVKKKDSMEIYILKDANGSHCGKITFKIKSEKSTTLNESINVVVPQSYATL